MNLMKFYVQDFYEFHNNNENAINKFFQNFKY